MGIFVIYYLISTGYMLLIVFRYREYLAKHPITENIGFELLAFLQLISGFIVAPYCLYYDIKVTYSKLTYNKRLAKDIKDRRTRFIIETGFDEHTIFTDHLNNKVRTLESFIDDMIYTMELRGDRFGCDQYIVMSDRRIGWMDDGDPDKLLENGWRKIVTVKTVIQVVRS